MVAVCCGWQVFDRLPCPFGLVRYGVAPDHPKIKSISAALATMLQDPAVLFLGNVELGATIEDLYRHYDALIVASGSAVDRRLGIAGEDRPGSFSATDFVAWYSGHPDAPTDRFVLDARRVAVIGAGNVAVDVTRMLAKSADDLRMTDLPDHVLKVLERSRVEDIYLIGGGGAQSRPSSPPRSCASLASWPTPTCSSSLMSLSWMRPAGRDLRPNPSRGAI